MIGSHLTHMVIYSAIGSVVFAVLSRDGRRERLRYGLKLFGVMTLGSLLAAWLMYPFPRS